MTDTVNVKFPIYEFIPSFSDVLCVVKTLKEQVKDVSFSKDTLLAFLDKQNIKYYRVEVNGEPIENASGEVLADYTDKEVWEWVRIDPYNCLEYLYLHLDPQGKVVYVSFDVPYDVNDKSENGYEQLIDYISIGKFDGDVTLSQCEYYEKLQEAMKYSSFSKSIVGYENVINEILQW